MNTFDRLQRKLKFLNGFNLMYICVALYAAGAIIARFPITFMYLVFSPADIMKGQIWRLVTFLMIPSSTDIFSVLLTCFVYFSISKALEMTIGRFRLNFFLISGILIEIIMGFLYYVLFEESAYVVLMNPYYLYAMLFVLFAMMFPDARFLFMFIFPIRGKWMVFITMILYLVDVVQAFYYGMTGRAWMLIFMIIAAVLTLVLYLLLSNYRAGKRNNVVRMQYRKAAEQAQQKAVKEPRHRCAVCGKTELTHPDLEFRYCTKCEGNYEYCMEHLYTHLHVKAGEKGETENE